MSEVVIFAMLTIWALAISIAILAIVRQLAVYQLALDALGPAFKFDFNMDGLKVGAAVPSSALARLKKHLESLDLLTVVMISPGCPPCRTIAKGIANSGHLMNRSVVFIVPGAAARAAEMVSQLSTTGALVVGDPHAHDIAQALEIHSTPFAMNIANGVVAAKQYVRGADELLAFTQALTGKEGAMIGGPA